MPPPPAPTPPAPIPPGPAPPCKAKLDVVVVLDGSGSIRSADWKRALAFTNSIVDSFHVSSDEVEIAAVQFSSKTCLSAVACSSRPFRIPEVCPFFLAVSTSLVCWASTLFLYLFRRQYWSRWRGTR